MMEAEFVDRMP